MTYKNAIFKNLEIRRRDLVNHIFIVEDFDRNGTIMKGVSIQITNDSIIGKVEKDFRIQTTNLFQPYGYLKVYSPIIPVLFKRRYKDLIMPIDHLIIPINHKVDFVAAHVIFNSPIKERLRLESSASNSEEALELLVAYVPKFLIRNTLPLPFLHVLHFIIAPFGTLVDYYLDQNLVHISKPNPKVIFGSFAYASTRPEVKIKIKSKVNNREGIRSKFIYILLFLLIFP